MIGLDQVFYFSIIIVALVLSVLGLWFTMAMPGIDRWSRRFFRSYFIILQAIGFSCLVEAILMLFPAPREAVYLTIVLECLLLSWPLPMLTIYLLHSSREDHRASRLMLTVTGLWVIYCVMLPFASLFGAIVYEGQENTYLRGPLYPLLLLPLVVILLLNLVGTVRRRKKLSQKAFVSFLVAQLPLTLALLLQLFFEVLPFFDIGYVLSALVMYSFALSNQIEQDLSRQREIARQQQEIASQRASIMVLQMRPHFIYNTMMSIYCLCNQDPQLARQVIMDFTTYLRKNFTAVASSTPVPFSQELEHTCAYLAVEQAQYEDSLSVSYDTPHTRFRVPPLTLQPIVENAVKHGRDPYAGPLEISVRTRKTETGSEVIVADDGRGFQPADESESHIALENIRQRLDIMCGGSLTITPNEGGGTVVTVFIPDKPAEPEEE